ncbi:MAG TPA: ABC transporter ATP-binding protein [Thermoplasmata archaeon]|nr:ABC transporter ATP-binding protein [Thermoplasmata archaeon]
MTDIRLSEVVVDRDRFRVGPIDLEIRSGSATVLLGPSGAGKTSLLRGIAGFLPLRQGAVRVDGVAVERSPPERRGFGFVPPGLGLFPHRRVRQNVSYPLDLRGTPDARARVQRWIDHFELSELAERYPAQLSSGQRQRVAMARALAGEPRALLWDEPLAALDVESRDVLLRLLRELIESEGIPLLLVTHDPATAFALASNVVVLEEGRVRFQGAVTALPHAPLNRFMARFLGFENLFSREELLAAGDGPLPRALLGDAGPSGIVVPDDALSWTAASSDSDLARITSVRWAPRGWVLTLRQGALAFYVHSPSDSLRLRVGDTVRLDLDRTRLRPLTAEGAS